MPYRSRTSSTVQAVPFRARLWRVVFRLYRGVVRRLASSLTRRIALLNLAGLCVLFLGFLWLNQTRIGVIDARSQSLALQAELIAGAIAGVLPVDDGPLDFDPDKILQQQLEQVPREENQPAWLEFSINPARAAPILYRLVAPTRTRARIFDRDGTLLLDSRAFYRPGNQDGVVIEEDNTTLFSRSWNAVKQRLGRISLDSGDETAAQRPFFEVGKALGGTASTVVRVASDGQTLVYAAVPVQRGALVRGALLLSTQEGDVDRIIADERWGFFLVFLIASGVMLVLSVLLAGTIAEPVRRLSEAADRVRRGTRARHEIPDFSARHDEIGQLSASLRDMTSALYNRIEGIERFAADVSHELKNPLTSLRSAVETLPLAKSDESKKRLLDVIFHDVKRLDRLITDISDASRLDAEMQRVEVEPVDLGALLETVIGMRKEIADHAADSLVLKLPADPKERSLRVNGHDSRLVQVFDNLIENALSFSPPGGVVTVSAERKGDSVDIAIKDEGPGIPEHALLRIFERFYTDRPDHGFGQHSGLGLAISRQIIEAHGGSIVAANRKDRQGAEFTVRLPFVPQIGNPKSFSGRV